MTVGVVNYGVGNLGSVRRALTDLQAQVVIAADPAALNGVSRIVLPGVGAFGESMARLRAGGWVEALQQQVDAGTPLLGICLGMQLLASSSEENGLSDGLGLIAGRVRRLDAFGCSLRIPHVGWNEVRFDEAGVLFEQIPQATDFYFVHSYAFEPADRTTVCATTEYGAPLAAAVRQGRVFGTQFHPEKSSRAAGLEELPRFSMLKIRVIPTLLWKDFGLVKGVQFDSWRRVGSVLPAIKVYNARDVDELVLVDITASTEGHSPDHESVSDFADECSVPLTVGGGVRTHAQIVSLLHAGADKVVLNTALFDEPGLVDQAARHFGSQCVVASVDVRRRDAGEPSCMSHSGSRDTGRDPVAWSRELADRGAGEILLTSVDRDGTMTGYDLDLIARVAASVAIPVIASGGAGRYQHMIDAVAQGGASAVAAASIFHFTEHTPAGAKAAMAAAGIPVRRNFAGAVPA